ncbi:hypothetical protein [Embleya sp. NPDC059259]|uniref:hypothetical protein n=1 Tax=unclassified Embleya TaxID=2699296 RepID=UPI00368369F3
MSAPPDRARGHGEDDTPFTHRGFGDADVVLDVPVRGRIALVRIESAPGEQLRLWRIERPGGPVGWCAYDGPAEGSDASILTVDGQGRVLRAVRVRCAGAWSLRLRDPDAVREFERSIAGVGSEVLRYTGPLGVGRLIGTRSGGPVDVRLLPPSAGADAAAGTWQEIDPHPEQPWQSWEFGVVGPQMMVVTARGPWSIDVEPTPSIRPDLPEGTFVLHGVGDLTAIVPIPDAGEAAVLEVVWVSGATFTVACEASGDYGAPRHLLGPDRPCLRFRLGAELRARGVPVRILGRGSEWELRTTTPGATRTGTGLGVADFDAAEVAGFPKLPMRVILGRDAPGADVESGAGQWPRPAWAPGAEGDAGSSPGRAANPPRPGRSWARRLVDRLRRSSD